MMIAPLDQHQVEQAGAVLARAFAPEPLSVYLVPDAEERAAALLAAFTGWVRSGPFIVDVAIAGDTVLGVAVWSAPSVSPAPTVAGDRDDEPPEELRTWSTPAQQRFTAYFSYVSALHARLMPEQHWYLALLGVDPLYQGNGYGSALLTLRLAQARAAGLPCYLETGTTRNVGLYERHGFQVIETATAPGTGVRFWAMRRD